MEHILKIGKEYLENILEFKKKSEIRYNDRDYQVDDILVFWSGGNLKKYKFKITHIHSGLGLMNGYVVLSIERIH